MKLTSPVFENNGIIPQKYTCQGNNINPPLMIRNIPNGTVSLALIIDDPDAPMKTWDHWVMWNIKPVAEIPENSALGEQGKNSWGNNHYGGPCPPNGTHRYFFKLYALDCDLNLSRKATKLDLEAAMENHILESVNLIGLYQKV
ncbi:phospholipid-binding protein, PBP family [Halothece sp. PCC 7418]|uniref:YbhB/YbcL family Raf kinase inhibitor-like protein n=1 Tax=Halothece sp. (strain PCC 7418) TaxID=65093 RepID=UPI0002A06579|nr:YbhB/YbcL family Raf kinase inhibitor-like protein [Halothece sp. PCC 7418]AFZ45601.1 phospholipid-binding protein, PBP family [Halothece sp. PCC 7418]